MGIPRHHESRTPNESVIHNLYAHIPEEFLHHPMCAHPFLLALLLPIRFCGRNAETWMAAAPTTAACLSIRNRVTPNGGREPTTRRLEGIEFSRACGTHLVAACHRPLNSPQQAGYSSVGRASDCRMLQQSDGPWFDSGWPD